MSFLKFSFIFYYCISVHAAPSQNRPISSEVSDWIEESVDSQEHCPIGHPLELSSGSFVLCGQCKPFADCPSTHFCKLDSPSKPGYCCLRKSGTAEGAVKQSSSRSPPHIVLHKKAEESLSAVVISRLGPVTTVPSNETDLYGEDGEYGDSSSTIAGVENGSPVTRRPPIHVNSTQEVHVNVQVAKPVDERELTGLITSGNQRPLAMPEATATVPGMGMLYMTTTRHHLLTGAISDSALAINWPSRTTQPTGTIPSKIIIQEKFARRRLQRPMNDPPTVNFSHMFPPDLASQVTTRSADTLPIPFIPEDYWKDGGRLSSSSGRFKPCLSHTDCHQLGQPPEWCRPNIQSIGRDCFCAFNASMPACVVQRENDDVLEWTFCTTARQHGCP